MIAGTRRIATGGTVKTGTAAIVKTATGGTVKTATVAIATAR